MKLADASPALVKKGLETPNLCIYQLLYLCVTEIFVGIVSSITVPVITARILNSDESVKVLN